MPRKNPLPDTELGIGKRLTQFRAEFRLSREDIARIAQVPADILTRVELARMPLRYDDARKILGALGSPHPRLVWPDLRPINPLWLADGREPVQLEWPLLLPRIDALELPPSLRFSRFVEMHRDLLVALTADEPDAELPESWLWPYLLHLTGLQLKAGKLEEAILRVENLFRSSAERLASRSQRAADCLKRYYAPWPDWAKRFSSRTALTEISVSANLTIMKSPLAQLRERLNQATAAKGGKAKLAEYLKAPRPCVSDWLSGKREPSGETTLRLLQWVEQQERQQNKSPGSALTQPEPKTQSKASNEKKPKSGRKKE